MDLYLVAWLLPPAVSQPIWALKQEVHQRTGSRNALRLPPHLTLLPPVRLAAPTAEALMPLLARFAATNPACPVQLRDFGWFGQRTLLVQVMPSAALQRLHQQFFAACARELPAIPAPTRPFVPHVTLATRDLPAEQVPGLQARFAGRTFAADTQLQELVLYRHTGQVWQPLHHYWHPLG